MSKGYTKISLIGVNTADLMKLNEMIDKKKWKILHYKKGGDIYTIVPSTLAPKIRKILGLEFL